MEKSLELSNNTSNTGLTDEEIKQQYNNRATQIKNKYINFLEFVNGLVHILTEEPFYMDYKNKKFTYLQFGLLGRNSDDRGAIYSQFIEYFDRPIIQIRDLDKYDFEYLLNDNIITIIEEYMKLLAFDYIKNYDGNIVLSKTGQRLKNFKTCEKCILFKNEPTFNKADYYYKNAVNQFNLIKKLVDELFNIINNNSELKSFIIFYMLNNDNLYKSFKDFLFNKNKLQEPIPAQLIKFKDEIQQIFNPEYRKKILNDLKLDSYKFKSDELLQVLESIANYIQEYYQVSIIKGGNINKIKRKSPMKKRSKSPVNKQRKSPKNKQKSPSKKRK